MPADSLTDYSFERGNYLHSLGADVQHATFDVGDELILTASLSFAGGRCILTVWEAVEIVSGCPHRRKYGYRILVGAALGFGYDRDPTHVDMPEHKHLPDGRRVPWDPVKLEEVVDEVLDLLSQVDADEDETDADGAG
jgi:hypothetical protein